VWKIKEGKLQQFSIFTTAENIKGKNWFGMARSAFSSVKKCQIRIKWKKC